MSRVKGGQSRSLTLPAPFRYSLAHEGLTCGGRGVEHSFDQVAKFHEIVIFGRLPEISVCTQGRHLISIPPGIRRGNSDNRDVGASPALADIPQHLGTLSF